MKAKTAVIYNACAPTPAVDYSIKEKSIIMAAFLNDNKHPDLLLKAWKNLKADFPDWHLTIMGNGEVERFQTMAHDMGLDDNVTLSKFTRITFITVLVIWFALCLFNLWIYFFNF